MSVTEHDAAILWPVKIGDVVNEDDSPAGANAEADDDAAADEQDQDHSAPAEPTEPQPTPPPGEAMVLPDPTTVQVPADGDVDPSRASRSAVHVPGGSPAPRKPLRPAVLPKTHEGDAKPFECLGHDECYFPRMPFYNQANPNFSQVRIPKSIYDADKKKLTGPTQQDGSGQLGIVMKKKDGTQVVDPYYDTWLPLGPLSPQDDGYIGFWHTALCGPSSESMALMAALAAKGPHARAKPGSWLHRSFIQARRPSSQAPLPSPLLKDHTTLAPGSREMTAKEIQRVVNMAVRQKTSPMTGGSGGVFLKIADEFEPVNGRSPVKTTSIRHPTNEGVMEAVRNRFAPTIIMGTFKASLQPVSQDGKVVKYTLTFKRHGGHFVAVNGFSRRGKHPNLLIYNPVYSKPVRQTIVQLHTRGVTKDGVPVEVISPFGDKIAIFNDVLASGDLDGHKDLGELSDGDNLHIIEHAQAVKIG